MTSPIDRTLVSRLAHDTAVMSRQLSDLSIGIGLLRGQLENLQQSAAPRPAPSPVPQEQPTRPVPTPPQQWTPPQQRIPVPVREPAEPWWQRDGVISRILAVAGAGVTLIGVVMLLVLAAKAGFFGPPARVAAGAVFSAALVGVAFRVHSRPGGRVGAIALAATGFAGGYLDVVAMTTIYEWIPAAAGLALAAAIAAASIVVAVRWDAQQLAILSVLGVAVLAPVVTDGINVSLIAFLCVLQAAVAPVHLVRSWSYLHAARTAPVVFALCVSVPMTYSSDDAMRTLIGSLVVVVVGVLSGLVSVRRTPQDVAASVVLAMSVLPLLLWAGTASDDLGRGNWPGIVTVGVAAAVLTGLSLVRSLPSHTRMSLLVAAVVSTLEAAVVGTDGGTLGLALLGIACGYLAAGGQARLKIAVAVGAGFAVLGGFAFLDIASPDALVVARVAVRSLDAVVLVTGVLALAVAGIGVWAVRRLGDEFIDRAWAVCAGFAVLYVVTALTVTGGVLIGGENGFTTGHMVATILWMAGAAALLLWGLRVPKHAHVALACGLSLTAASVSKLFLYDLAALDGIVRVAAFIVVGLLLLVVGTRYAREFAERG